MIETIENKVTDLLANAHKLPGWGVHPFDTYNEFRKFSGIVIKHPKDLYFINERLIKAFTKNLIENYCKKVAAIGLISGAPGGPIGYAGLISDIEEYLRASFNLSQEIMYIHGIIPHPFVEEVEIDKNLFLESIREETLKAMAIGLGASSISVISKELSIRLAEKEAKEIIRKKVSEKLITKLAKQIAKLLGIKVTKKSLSKLVLRALPIIGGISSSIINYKSFKKIGENLQIAMEKEREEIRKIINSRERKNIIIKEEREKNEPNKNDTDSTK